jgi:hypothetical protein
MADIDEFIARSIALDRKRGDVIAKRDFERGLGAERKLADTRMQPVGADDQVDCARGGMVEADPHTVSRILDPRNRVAKDCLNLSV